MAQAVQELAPAALNRPATQLLQKDAPPTLNVPATQRAQEVEAAAALKVPTAHGAHDAVLPSATVLPKKPLAHWLQEDAPAALIVPTGHKTHAAGDAPPAAPLNFPAGHAMQAIMDVAPVAAE